MKQLRIVPQQFWKARKYSTEDVRCTPQSVKALLWVSVVIGKVETAATPVRLWLLESSVTEGHQSMRFAILGAARIAKTVAPGIKAADGAELVAVASRELGKAQAFAAEFDIPRSYGSYEAALEDPDVDAVYLPLPPSLHAEWTIKAAAAGKHILCEKPLALNVDEVDRMVSACREHGVVLMDGVMWYHTERAGGIKALIASGDLGDLKQCTSVFTFRWDTWPMEDLRMHRHMGGGSLLDLGWYCIGLTLMAFGELPERVVGHGQWCNDVDTRMNATLWFSDNRMATIESGFDTVRRRWFELAGTQRAIVCDDFTRPWNPKKPRFWVHDADGVSQEYVFGAKPQEESMVESFIGLARDNAIDHEWLQLSRQTQLVCDALDRSARTGETVRL